MPAFTLEVTYDKFTSTENVRYPSIQRGIVGAHLRYPNATSIKLTASDGSFISWSKEEE